MQGRAAQQPFDVLVIGAGLSGLYALHKLRQEGWRVRVLEQADGVGGTWLYNRYPGARCDIESVEYSYSFPEIQQEWVWTELMAAQPEIEAYVNFVADRLDLRRDIEFGTTVTRMTFESDCAQWHIDTAAGTRFTARFVVAATGPLSVPLEVPFDGAEQFQGLAVHSSRFPREGVDFTGRRVAIVGTGSTGVQLLPHVAEQAAHVWVFQRSGAYTFPAEIRPYEPGEFEALRAHYPQLRAGQQLSITGISRNSAFSWALEAATRPPIKSTTPAERTRAVDERGRIGAVLWSDVYADYEANEMARALYGEAVARIVHDPETARSLIPSHPFGCKRPIIDSGYYEAFNRENVSLVDLRKGGIREITSTGIRTEQSHYEVDVIVYAMGFDAMTGALTRIDVRGRDDASLAEVWRREGPVSYLGFQVAGFPNLFMTIGPGSPGALANIAVSLEYQVDWIAACLAHMRAQGKQVIEAQRDAQLRWADHVASLVESTMMVHPTCNAWWIGANVPGKKRMQLSYAAGLPEYRRECDEIATVGYAGFDIR